MLEIKNVSVKYGDFTALDNISFNAMPKNFTMIVGPNGAGKSTILNAISQGTNYSGEILLDGKNLKTMNAQERARKIGILTQNHFVGYDYTVEEVVSMGRYSHSKKMFHSPTIEDKKMIDAALEKTGLSEYRNKSVLKLSGGELQRTFLAQVFAQDPSVLLLDEPTNHLDLSYQKQVFELTGEWLKEKNKMIVAVVHDLSLAKTFGDYAILLNHGSKVTEGNACDVIKGDTINSIYDIDVEDWMKKILSKW